MERFSNECRKTKNKVITLANQKGRRHVVDTKRGKMRTRQPRLVLVLEVSLLIGWKSGARTWNQSLIEVMQNQSNSLITFDTQLKTALFGYIKRIHRGKKSLFEVRFIDERLKWSSHLSRQFKQLSFTDTWKIQVTPTGFEPMTSERPVQRSTNWALKPNRSICSCVPVKGIMKERNVYLPVCLKHALSQAFHKNWWLQQIDLLPTGAWLHSSVGRALHRYQEVLGSNPAKAAWILQVSGPDKCKHYFNVSSSQKYINKCRKT